MGNNSIPFIWDDGQQQLYEDVLANTYKWKQSKYNNRLNTPFGFKSTFDILPDLKVEDFKDDFYTTEINFDQLAKDLKAQLPFGNFVFDYKKYESKATVKISLQDPEHIGSNLDSKKNVPVPFNYLNENKEKQNAYFAGSKLNTLKYYVEDNFSFSVIFHDSKIDYILYLPYKKTKQYRTNAPETDNPNDFHVEDKYNAITLVTNNCQDIFAFVNAVKGNKESLWYQQSITRRFNDFFTKAANNEKQLKALYEQAPLFALKARQDKFKISDIQLLLAYDKGNWIIDGWFKDSTNALINLLNGFNNIDTLYQYFFSNPEKLVEIYSYLSDSGKAELCKILLTIIQAHKIVSKNNSIDIVDTFHLGKEYKIDSDVNYKVGKTIKLNFYKLHTTKETVPTNNNSFVPTSPSSTNEVTTITKELISGANYHPMAMIKLINNDPTNGFSTTLPALSFKNMADTEEWASIKDTIIVSATILSILLSAGTLAAGASAFWTAMAIGDIAVGTTDLALRNKAIQDEIKKLPGGAWFVDHWDEIYAVAGGLMFSALAVKGILVNGPKLFAALEKAPLTTRNFIMAVYASAVIQLEIINFIPSSLRFLPKVEEVIKASNFFFKTSEIIKLYKAECYMLQGEMQLGKQTKQGFALIHEGEVIGSGTREEVQKIVKEIVEAKDVTKILDELHDFSIISKNEKFLNELARVLNKKNRILAEWLTVKEEAIIRYYTTGAYDNLNKALRFLKDMMAPELKSFTKLLNSALSKLPNFPDQSLLYRVVKFSEGEIKNLFVEGKTYIEEGFTSTTYTEESMKRWFRDFPSSNVLMKIKGKNGKLIEQASDILEENEILFKSGTPYDVLSVKKIDHPIDINKKIIEIILKEK